MGRRDAGFTLIELLVVVAVIAILAAVAIPAMLTAVDKSKQRGSMADMRQIGQGVQLYEVDNSQFVADGTAASSLVQLIEPFTMSVLRHKDHWAHDYRYNTDGSTWYSIESFGRDGVDGIDITTSTALQFELDLVYASGRFINAPFN